MAEIDYGNFRIGEDGTIHSYGDSTNKENRESLGVIAPGRNMLINGRFHVAFKSKNCAMYWEDVWQGEYPGYISWGNLLAHWSFFTNSSNVMIKEGSLEFLPATRGKCIKARCSQECFDPGQKEVEGAPSFYMRIHIETTGHKLGWKSEHSFSQAIETLNLTASRPMVLSFWARSTIPNKKISAALIQHYGEEGSIKKIPGTVFTLSNNWKRYIVYYDPLEVSSDIKKRSRTYLKFYYQAGTAHAHNTGMQPLHKPIKNINNQAFITTDSSGNTLEELYNLHEWEQGGFTKEQAQIYQRSSINENNNYILYPGQYDSQEGEYDVGYELPIGGIGTIDIADVQLEEGKVVTEVERRILAQEIILCSRFQEKSYNLDRFEGQNSYSNKENIKDFHTSYLINGSARGQILLQHRKPHAELDIRFWDRAGNANCLSNQDKIDGIQYVSGEMVVSKSELGYTYNFYVPTVYVQYRKDYYYQIQDWNSIYPGWKYIIEEIEVRQTTTTPGKGNIISKPVMLKQEWWTEDNNQTWDKSGTPPQILPSNQVENYEEEEETVDSVTYKKIYYTRQENKYSTSTEVYWHWVVEADYV